MDYPPRSTKLPCTQLVSLCLRCDTTRHPHNILAPSRRLISASVKYPQKRKSPSMLSQVGPNWRASSASQGCILIRRIKIRPYLWKDAFVASLNLGSAKVGKVTRCIDGLVILHSASSTMPANARRTATLPSTLSTLTLTCSRAARNASERPCTTRVRDSTPPTCVLRTHSFALAPQVAFHVGNAQQLDPEKVPDNTYDLYTTIFGIRNCTSVSDVIKEAYRVLKPGGASAVLEFSKVTQPILAQ